MTTGAQDSIQSPSNTQSQPCSAQPAPESQAQPTVQKAPVAPQVAPTKTGSKLNNIFLMIMVSLISSVASIAAYDHFLAQKVVAVDIKSFIEEKKADYVAGRLDDAGMKREMDKLEATVAAIPKNKAVLMGDLVVKNVQVIKP